MTIGTRSKGQRNALTGHSVRDEPALHIPLIDQTLGHRPSADKEEQGIIVCDGWGGALSPHVSAPRLPNYEPNVAGRECVDAVILSNNKTKELFGIGRLKPHDAWLHKDSSSALREAVEICLTRSGDEPRVIICSEGAHRSVRKLDTLGQVVSTPLVGNKLGQNVDQEHLEANILAQGDASTVVVLTAGRSFDEFCETASKHILDLCHDKGIPVVLDMSITLNYLLLPPQSETSSLSPEMHVQQEQLQEMLKHPAIKMLVCSTSKFVGPRGGAGAWLYFVNDEENAPELAESRKRMLNASGLSHYAAGNPIVRATTWGAHSFLESLQTMENLELGGARAVAQMAHTTALHCAQRLKACGIESLPVRGSAVIVPLDAVKSLDELNKIIDSLRQDGIQIGHVQQCGNTLRIVFRANEQPSHEAVERIVKEVSKALSKSYTAPTPQEMLWPPSEEILRGRSILELSSPFIDRVQAQYSKRRDFREIERQTSLVWGGVGFIKS